MKKIFLSFLFVMTVLSLSVSALQLSSQNLNIGCENGDIVVSGSFTAADAAQEKYNVYFVTYKHNGIIDKVEISPDFTLYNGINTFNATYEVASKEQITKAFVLTEKLAPICEPVEKTIKSLRVLSIGNSYSIDAQEWLYGIAKDGGFDNVILGNLYIGGCSLQTHSGHADSGAAAYSYSKNTTGTWSHLGAKSMLYGIMDENWDYITLQQNSANSGTASTFEPYLSNVISYVKANMTNPEAELVWHMTWAYAEGYAATSVYKSQSNMYASIVDVAQQLIVTNDNFSFIIPVGTAVQNARTSYVGDNFNRDGTHLDYNYGRYLAGLTWFHKMTGQSIDDISYIPNNSFSEEYLKILKEAAKNAVANPFEVTQSIYTENPEPEIDLNDYILVDWEPMKNLFYNSSSSSIPGTSDVHNNKFICSKIFTREELPVGTIIEVDAGYQYRPEGWVDLNTKNTVRPDNMTAARIIIDEAWWGDYNYRAFNLSKIAASDICTNFEESCTHFRIYVPKDLYNSETIPTGYIDWEPMKNLFYNSPVSSTPGTSTGHNNKFICSKIFTREELPVGTIIEVDAGYQYRPEGWVDLNTKNTVRPDNVTTSRVIVDEAWWGDYNYRAFNLSKTDQSDICTNFEESCTHFRIYVPKVYWTPMKNLFYNSLVSSTPGTSDGHNNKFICSKIFTREELPVGTIIEVDAGYQYRPEGWVDLNTKNTVRPDNVTTSSVIIDEAWWGDYNYRAFNLSKTDQSDICTNFEESITHFRIYFAE